MNVEMPDDSTVSCYDDHSKAYDEYQLAVVPCYVDMLDLVARTCRRYLGNKPKILDLGCGTGNASVALLKRYPPQGVSIFLIDGSKHMVEIAREKVNLASPGSVIGSRVADFSVDGWDEGLSSEGFDAVISTLVLEHLPFESYKKVLDSCYRLLKPGGWLIAVEGYEEEDSDMQQWFNEEMEQRRQKLNPRMSDFIAGLREQKEVHYYCSKGQKMDWWREAGFQQVNVLWQYLCIALMVGRKPP
jgi:tRNA (cmo5U34)-methyltransferase